MSDTLPTRIAAVIALHPQGDEYGLPDGTCRGCGWPKKQSDYGIDYSEHVADAVIRELGLHLQPAKGHYRYVTDWVADV